MTEINIYCDESNHLEHDSRPMALGAISCPREKTYLINKRVREIKKEHNLPATFEIKWSKVAKQRLPFYIDLLNYFFDIDDLGVRIIIANKANLDHNGHNQTHDEWYYKMYYLLLTKMIRTGITYRVCLDRKDSLGNTRIKKLRECLCNREYDFRQEIIKEIREVHSDRVPIIQLVDLIIGAVQFQQCSLDSTKESKTKRAIVEHIQRKSGRSLMHNTLPSEPKFNLFFWQAQS